MRMTTRQVLVAVFLFGLIAVGSASASGAHLRRHPHASTGRAPVYSSSFEPARMIELRPGLFISSYGCVTDEGQGRWLPCDIN